MDRSTTPELRERPAPASAARQQAAVGLSGEGLVLWPDDTASPASMQQLSTSRASSPTAVASPAAESHGDAALLPPPSTPSVLAAVSPPQPPPPPPRRQTAVAKPTLQAAAPEHAGFTSPAVPQRPHSEGDVIHGRSGEPFVSKLLQSQASLYARLSSTETNLLKGLADSTASTAEQLSALLQQQAQLMQRLGARAQPVDANSAGESAARIAVLEADFANCEQDRQALAGRLAAAEGRARDAEAAAARLQGQLQALAAAKEDAQRLQDTVQRQSAELLQLRAQLRNEQDLRQRQVREAMRALQSS